MVASSGVVLDGFAGDGRFVCYFVVVMLEYSIETQWSCYLMLWFDEEQILKAVLVADGGVFMFSDGLSCWRAHPLAC